MTDQQLRSALVEELRSQGALTSPEWVDAFLEVPRHAFAPRAFKLAPDREHWQTIAPGDDGYLELLYSDMPVATQINGDSTLWDTARTDGPISGTPTCSTTQPSVMAVMLEALDVHDGHKLLLVGTGTGYHTAIAAHRLKDANVTSIDIDAELTREAQTFLASTGHHPPLATVDGADGYPANAPYDRIIATCAFPRVPTAWLNQLNPNGKIILDLHLELASDALILLTKQPDGTAAGHFLNSDGHFMPTRSTANLDTLAAFKQAVKQTGRTRHTDLDVDPTDDTDPFTLFAALYLPRVGSLDFQPVDAGRQAWLLADDGSWTVKDHRTGTVEEGGERFLWDELEAAHQVWTQNGKPSKAQLGLTIDTDDQHFLWVEEPGHLLSTLP